MEKNIFKSYKCLSERQMYRRVKKSLSKLQQNLGKKYNNLQDSSNFTAVTSQENVQCKNFTKFTSENDSSFEKITDYECHNNSPIEPTLQIPTASLMDTIEQNIDESDNNLPDALRSWAVNFHITHCALTSVLHILSPLHQKLPLDSRTFLKTPIKLRTKIFETGEYCHFSLSDNIKKFLNSCSTFTGENVNISFNIDGLPLFHSSNIQVWPILALIKVEYVKTTPFAVGLFCKKILCKKFHCY